MVICKYLLDNSFLVLYINGINKYAMNNDSIGQHNEFCMLFYLSKPLFVLFELRCLGCNAGENLYVFTFKLMCHDNYNLFCDCIVMYNGLNLLFN
jgi:hypothetical protein